MTAERPAAGAKRVLLATYGSLGDLHPYIGLARTLAARGHRVALATLPIYRGSVEAAGIPFAPMRPDAPPPGPALDDLVRRIMDPADGPRFMWAEVIAPSVRAMHADLAAALDAMGGADVLVAHMLTPAVPIIAEQRGLPWVAVILQPLGFLSEADPPTLAQVPWLRSLLALHPLLARTFYRWGERLSRPWVEPVAALRRDLGLPAGPHPMFAGMLSPHLTLGHFSPHLVAAHDNLPPRTTLTGFPFDAAVDASLAPSAAPFARLLDRFLDKGEPPVLLTLGSSATLIGQDFYGHAAEAAALLGCRAILVGDPRHITATLPDGVLALPYVPYRQLMPRCAASAHHGGIGTTAEALRAGKPMLVVPYGVDQPDNARRCAALGVSRTLSKRSLSARSLADALAGLLGDRRTIERAAALGPLVAAERGAEAAAAAIEAL